MNLTRLGDVCEIQKGKVAITKAVEGKYPLITTAEERGTHNEWHFELPSVMVPMVSSTGHGHASIKRLHYATGKFAVGNILAVITPKDPNKLSAKYLYAYLTFYKEEKLVNLMKGSANVSLTLGKLNTVEIEIPDMERQKSIEAFVDLVDKLDLEIQSYKDSALKLTQAGLQKLLKT